LAPRVSSPTQPPLARHRERRRHAPRTLFTLAGKYLLFPVVM